MLVQLIITAAMVSGFEPSHEQSPAEAAPEAGLAVLDAQPNGEALVDYTLCWVTERAKNHPYYSTLGPREVFPDSEQIFTELDREMLQFGQIELSELQAAALSELERRELDKPCDHLLVPDPDALRIMADRATYRRDAMMGHVDPAQDYRDFVDAQIAIFLDQPNADRLLRLAACLAYTDPFERHTLNLPRPGEIAADPERFEAQAGALIEVQSRLIAVEEMYDMDQIWQQAQASHTPLPVCAECVALYERYSPTYSAERQSDGGT